MPEPLRSEPNVARCTESVNPRQGPPDPLKPLGPCGFPCHSCLTPLLDAFSFCPAAVTPLFGASMHRILAVTLAGLLVPVHPTPAPARAASPDVRALADTGKKN